MVTKQQPIKTEAHNGGCTEENLAPREVRGVRTEFNLKKLILCSLQRFLIHEERQLSETSFMTHASLWETW